MGRLESNRHDNQFLIVDGEIRKCATNRYDECPILAGFARVGFLVFDSEPKRLYQIVLIWWKFRIERSFVTRANPSNIAVAPIRRSLGSFE